MSGKNILQSSTEHEVSWENPNKYIPFGQLEVICCWKFQAGNL